MSKSVGNGSGDYLAENGAGSDELSPLAQELGRDRPFRDGTQEAMISLMYTASRIDREVSDRIATFGITPQQFNLLRILRGAAARTPSESSLPLKELRRRLIDHNADVPRLVRRLEEKGLVALCRGDADRRETRCSLTNLGRVLLARIDEWDPQFPDGIFAALTAEELQGITALMARVRSCLH
jgi:DNA-binding MarR family transcriptional regulator